MPLTTYTAGEVLTAASLNANFSAVSSSFATFNETQANGTDGGASVATTWTTRVLNTTVINGITGASLATNQVTLPAGTYTVTVFSPFRNTNLTKIRLYNITDSASLMVWK